MNTYKIEKVSFLSYLEKNRQNIATISFFSIINSVKKTKFKIFLLDQLYTIILHIMASKKFQNSILSKIYRSKTWFWGFAIPDLLLNIEQCDWFKSEFNHFSIWMRLFWSKLFQRLLGYNRIKSVRAGLVRFMTNIEIKGVKQTFFVLMTIFQKYFVFEICVVFS